MHEFNDLIRAWWPVVVMCGMAAIGYLELRWTVAQIIKQLKDDAESVDQVPLIEEKTNRLWAEVEKMKSDLEAHKRHFWDNVHEFKSFHSAQLQINENIHGHIQEVKQLLMRLDEYLRTNNREGKR